MALTVSSTRDRSSLALPTFKEASLPRRASRLERFAELVSALDSVNQFTFQAAVDILSGLKPKSNGVEAREFLAKLAAAETDDFDKDEDDTKENPFAKSEEEDSSDYEPDKDDKKESSVKTSLQYQWTGDGGNYDASVPDSLTGPSGYAWNSEFGTAATDHRGVNRQDFTSLEEAQAWVQQQLDSDSEWLNYEKEWADTNARAYQENPYFDPYID